MKALPFRLKIALLSTAISGVVLAGFGSAAYFLIAEQKTDALDTEIRSLGIRHRGWLGNRQNFQRIEATLVGEIGNIVFTLCNTGPGIPEPDQARIFTRFHRVDTARERSADSVGLGLSLSREIIRAHGGELDLRDCRPGWT